jgi:hypothetical protein
MITVVVSEIITQKKNQDQMDIKSKKIITVNKELVKDKLCEVVRETVDETLNKILDKYLYSFINNCTLTNYRIFEHN